MASLISTTSKSDTHSVGPHPLGVTEHVKSQLIKQPLQSGTIDWGTSFRIRLPNNINKFIRNGFLRLVLPAGTDNTPWLPSPMFIRQIETRVGGSQLDITKGEHLLTHLRMTQSDSQYNATRDLYGHIDVRASGKEAKTVNIPLSGLPIFRNGFYARWVSGMPIELEIQMAEAKDVLYNSGHKVAAAILHGSFTHPTSRQ